MGSSECVVKALVVLEGAVRPLLTGCAAVTSLAGVASLLTLCVRTFCGGGLAQGSASGASKDSLRSVRDFDVEFAVGAGFTGVEVVARGSGAALWLFDDSDCLSC